MRAQDDIFVPAATGAPGSGVGAWRAGEDAAAPRASLAPPGMRPVSERPVEAVSPAVRGAACGMPLFVCGMPLFVCGVPGGSRRCVCFCV